MRNTMIFARFAAGCAGALLIVAAADGKAAQCPPFPEVAWWGELTHQAVVRRVTTEMKGNWAAYVQKWENEEALLVDVQSRGRAVVIGRTSIRLEGARLADYIEQVHGRVAVTRCLSEEMQARK